MLNHHDGVLWIGLARNGEWVTTYQSDRVLAAVHGGSQGSLRFRIVSACLVRHEVARRVV